MLAGGFAFEWEEKGSNESGGWGIKMERRHEEKMTQIEPFHEMESTENQKKNEELSRQQIRPYGALV